MKNKIKSFYTFKGSWFEIFDKHLGIFNAQHLQKFAIWASRSGNGENVLVIYGSQLKEVLQNKHSLRQISEPEFDMSLNGKARILKFMGIMNAIQA